MPDFRQMAGDLYRTIILGYPFLRVERILDDILFYDIFASRFRSSLDFMFLDKDNRMYFKFYCVYRGMP